MYPENAPAVLRIQTVWNNLNLGVFSIEANNKIPNDFKYPFSVLQAAQNKKQISTVGLAMLFQLKTGAKVLITINMIG